MNIYVGNLPKSTNEEAVRKVFETYGKVREVKLIQDKFTQELRGFGFVEMPSKTEAQEAIKNIDGSELEGRNLIVNEARPREDRSDNKNRRGGGGYSRSW
ncbi:MAG: RNA-binding protein [Chlorobi bacterium]|nr:RNA-binding protein [Chlorobiota bacterium]